MVVISKKVGDREPRMELLTNKKFSIEAFRAGYSNWDDCKGIVADKFQREVEGYGFSKQEVLDPDGKISCHMYSRSPVDVLRRQLKQSTTRKRLFRYVQEARRIGSPYFGHPMASGIDRDGTREVERVVKASSNPEVVWGERSRDGHESFAGVGQLYFDKSLTSIKSLLLLSTRCTSHCLTFLKRSSERSLRQG